MKIILAVNVGVFIFSVALFMSVASPVQAVPAAEDVLRMLTDDPQQIDDASDEDESEDSGSDFSENNREENNQSQDTQTEDQYSYVAQPGDSYTVMARKATQTHGLRNDISLSAAQIIFIETHITLEAGSPELSVGEEVSIDSSDVDEWIEHAQELNQAEEAEWQAYVSSVDFNTDSVGESS